MKPSVSRNNSSSQVLGEVSDEVRALSAERRQIWQTVADAETEEAQRAIMGQVEEITERINAKLKREFVE